jgi:hypothetical protein
MRTHNAIHMHELDKPLPALPDHRHAGFAIVRSAQKAPQVGNRPHRLADARRALRGKDDLFLAPGHF